MGRFLPPDHSQGDERTVGGYRAVHGRPAAFAGADGASYSVEVEADATGDAARPFGAYLLFVRWTPGEPRIAGHVETEFIAYGATPEAARADVDALPLERAQEILNETVRAHRPRPERPWWDAMRDEDGESGA